MSFTRVTIRLWWGMARLQAWRTNQVPEATAWGQMAMASEVHEAISRHMDQEAMQSLVRLAEGIKASVYQVTTEEDEAALKATNDFLDRLLDIEAPSQHPVD